MAICPLFQAKLPKTYWLSAIATACFLRNRVSPNKELKNPYEKFAGKKFQQEELKKFGCTIVERKTSRSKLDETALKFKRLGYNGHSPDYVAQDIQTKTSFLDGKAIFKESEKVSLKSEYEIGFNDFSDIEVLSLRQNAIETEVREQITGGQTVSPSYQAAVVRVFCDI